MPIQLVLEHDDFKKSRRALIASSVVLFVFSELTLLTNEIEIFKLKLLIDQSKLVVFSACTTLYFVYIFLIRAKEYVTIATALEPEKQLRLLSRELDETIRSFIVSQTLNSMDEGTMRQTLRRSGSQNTYELADGAASFAKEVKEIVSNPAGLSENHPHPEVVQGVEVINEIVVGIQSLLQRQLRRSNFVMYMVEIIPPFFVAGIAFVSGYMFVY